MPENSGLGRLIIQSRNTETTGVAVSWNERLAMPKESSRVSRPFEVTWRLLGQYLD